MKTTIVIIILASLFYWWQHEPVVNGTNVRKLEPKQWRQTGREQQTLDDAIHNRR